MTALFRFAAATASCLATVPTLANADISAADVWANWQAYVSAFGGTLTATTSNTGAGLSASGLVAEFTLPMEAGTLKVMHPDVTFRDTGDGRVEVVYPDTGTYGVAVALTGEPGLSGNVVIDMSQVQMIADGSAGDVTYEMTAPEISGTLGEWDAPTTPLGNSPEVDATMVLEDFATTMRVVEGPLLKVTQNGTFGAQSVSFTQKGPGDASTQSDTAVASGTFEIDFAMPANGIDLLNIAAAINQGMAFDIKSDTAGYSVQQTTTAPGLGPLEVRQGYDSSTFAASLDENGVAASGIGETLSTDVNLGVILPVPISVAVDRVEMDFAAPLSQGEAPQPFKLDMALLGLTLADQVWGLFDPSGGLPRDPAVIDIDVSGTMRNMVDLLNFNAVAAAAQNSLPVEVDSATINSLRIAAAGAEVTGTGALTFDNTDLESYDGVPKPVGELVFGLKGANQLLDTLVSIGLLSQQDASGARLGMAVVAAPDPSGGDDALKSTIIFNEDGGLTANGVPLK